MAGAALIIRAGCSRRTRTAEKHGRIWVQEQSTGDLRAWICVNCGYTELYTNNLEQLYESYKKSRLKTKRTRENGERRFFWLIKKRSSIRRQRICPSLAPCSQHPPFKSTRLGHLESFLQPTSTISPPWSDTIRSKLSKRSEADCKRRHSASPTQRSKGVGDPHAANGPTRGPGVSYHAFSIYSQIVPILQPRNVNLSPRAEIT